MKQPLAAVVLFILGYGPVYAKDESAVLNEYGT